MHTYVYIDGFNLYYGCLKNSPYKWLDLKSAIQSLLQPKNQIICIKYFTARVLAFPHDPKKPERQKIYLKALKAFIPELEIHYGKFLTHPVSMRLVEPMGDIKSVQVFKTEEKGSDVNLAVHLLNDTAQDKYDCAVLVSNDSDMAESLRLAKEDYKKVIGLITPRKVNNPSKQLEKYASFKRNLRNNTLKKVQLPNPIPATRFFKPESW